MSIMTWQCEPAPAVVNPSENPKNHVFQPVEWRPWPMTLTFKLIRRIVNPSTKFWVRISNGSSVSAKAWQNKIVVSCNPTDPWLKPLFQPSDLDFWPMTFKIIQGIIKVNPSTKFWVHASNGSAVRVLNYRRTDRQDRFYTLDLWHGRE